MRKRLVISVLLAIANGLPAAGCGPQAVAPAGPLGETCVPGPEQCNGADDDCDGIVDEDDSGAALQRDCSGPCGLGNEVCAGGAWISCTAPQPAIEVCDGLDNDCDGQVDEGFECALSAQQPCGSGVGECAEGTRICSNECKWGTCGGGASPGVEVCEGSKDEDCDGTVDDGCACTNGGRRSCCGGAEIVCEDGRWPACPAAPAESCNGLDDDCDSEVDEGLPVDPYLLDESVTAVDDCEHAKALGSIVEGAGPTSFSSYLYRPDLSVDRDYFVFVANEDSDLSCVVSPWSYECYTMTVRLEDVPAGSGYDFCVYDVGFEDSSATCAQPERVTCASDEEPHDQLLVHWEGDCGFSDRRYFFLEVFAAAASGTSCQPYRLTVESFESEPQDESCAF